MVTCLLPSAPLQTTWTDRLPDVDEMVAHPALALVPHKMQIPVEEDALLSYVPNLVEAVRYPAISMRCQHFFMARNILFHELQARGALHIWPHSIKLPPDPSDPYDILNDTYTL
jgi:hypothetical protein